MGCFSKKTPPSEERDVDPQPPQPPQPPKSAQTDVDQKARLKKEHAAMTSCSITLSNNTLDLSPNSTSWLSTKTEATSSRNKIAALEKQIEKQNEKLHEMTKKRNDIHRELNVFKFKQEVLLDMLAVSQADEKVSSTKLTKERIRSDQYRSELEKALTLCSQNGVEIV